jgi:hypothetical protein
LNDDPTTSDEDDGLPDSAVPARDLEELRRYERKKDRKRREEREGDLFWIAVFESKAGRREMWNLCANGMHAFKTQWAVTGIAPDNNATWYAKGEQDVGLRLYHEWIRRFPEKVALMHHENDPRFRKSKPRKVPAEPQSEFGFE